MDDRPVAEASLLLAERGLWIRRNFCPTWTEVDSDGRGFGCARLFLFKEVIEYRYDTHNPNAHHKGENHRTVHFRQNGVCHESE